MSYMLFFITAFMALCISNTSSETIEISTLASSMMSTVNPISAKSQNSEGNVLTDLVENFLSESTNLRKNDEPQKYVSQELVPVYAAPNRYFYPGVNPSDAAVSSGTELQGTNYFSSILPAAQAALHAALQLFTKLGLYLVSGAGLLILGGIFTTLLCYFTPICTITFNGLDFHQALNKDTMRSLMTPEKIATAAALVQDAIGKYQRLQRTVNQ